MGGGPWGRHVKFAMANSGDGKNDDAENDNDDVLFEFVCF